VVHHQQDAAVGWYDRLHIDVGAADDAEDREDGTGRQLGEPGQNRNACRRTYQNHRSQNYKHNDVAYDEGDTDY
jgi:hypothetical protein